MRGKSEESDEKLEGKIGPVMEVHMDANVVRSQLRYRPKGVDGCRAPRWGDSFFIITNFKEM